MRCSEHTRWTGIFGTADNGRSLGDKTRTVAAERYGTQVVLLLHRVALAVETERHDASVLDHRLVTRGTRIQAVARIERTSGHPHVLRLGRELVLELDMVEVLMPYIKTADADGQVVTC